VKLLDQLVSERAEIATAVEAVLDRAAEETRDLTEAEDKNLGDLTTRAKEIDARIADLREIQISHLEAAKLRAEVAATDEPEEPKAVNRVDVKSEPLTYEENSPNSFSATRMPPNFSVTSRPVSV
jgi:flagellar hook-length control protein FliK